MAVKIFVCYGRFCANYALEVIVFFLTAVVGAITLNLSSPYELCHWASGCGEAQSDTEISSDVVLLTVLRCGTIIYLYMQLKKIWKIGSLVIVGIVCAYMVCAVITFTVTVVHFLRQDMVIVGSALPVFLLLLDISRMVVLTKHCMTANSGSLIQDYIAEGMGTLIPVLTVDTLIELLVLINIGGYVQVRQLQQLSCFACLAVIINYIAFSTFVPASLSVLLTVINKTPKDDEAFTAPSWYDHRFAEVLQKERGKSENRFMKRIKFTSCIGLLFLHCFRWSILRGEAIGPIDKIQQSFDSVFTLTPEQLFTVVLIIILGSKYLLDDGYEIVTKLRKRSGSSEHNKMYSQNIQPKSKVRLSLCTDEGDVTTMPRTLEKCMELLKIGSDLLTDREIMSLVQHKKLLEYKLESALDDPNRGVAIRRKIISNKISDSRRRDALNHIPHCGYDFTNATKACCENTVGYIPVPIGIVGPLLLDGREYQIPMATTEGTLLASTNRGLKAVHLSGGIKSCVYSDGMSRAPVVSFPSIEKACQMSMWLQEKDNFNLVKERFDATSRFARLKTITPIISGRLLFLRFVANTGDAMGMNMLSKGTESSLRWLRGEFPDMEVISLSGNVCTDKKPSAVNWIMGRGKSVVCEAVLPEKVINSVLKTNINTLARLNRCKNHIGSAMSGSVGGFNAHSANIVTAMFIATGQDPAQNIVSSNCITTLEILSPDESRPSNSDGDSLLVTCTMPSLEVATVGGGSALEPQKACLNLLGVAGSSSSEAKKPGHNASQLARIICATVLAGELSLLSALDTGDLVQSHMKHNRLSRHVLQQEIEHPIL